MRQSTDRAIVPLKARHIPEIVRIEREVFPDPWSEGMLCAELDNTLSRWFVLEQAGRVLGYVAAMNICGEVHVTNVAVVPECRRQGCARLLLSQAVAAAKKDKALCLTLEVRESNAPAIALYRSFGFQPVGLRPRYYHEPEENALLMTLFLNEGNR